MQHALPFGIAYIMPVTAALGLALGGGWTFLTVVTVFVITPLLDAVLGLRTENLDAQGEAEAQASWAYDAWLWAWIPTQLALLVWGGSIFVASATLLERVGIVMSLGLLAGGGGINVAHELMHRKGKLPRAGAEILTTLASYTHFCVEHVLGHHKNVATPLDPASAPKGITLYRYLPQTILGSLVSAWKLESKRLQVQGIKPWSLRDRRLRYGIDIALVYALFFGLFGGLGALFFAAQSIVAFGLLEVINYVEHYGLARKQLPDGRYERVLPQHSWNSAHRLTGYYLFNLPRHADHHYLASRPYMILRHLPESPQLPVGYPTMVLLAMVPPLYFRVMNPRVEAWNAGQPIAAEPRGALELSIP